MAVSKGTDNRSFKKRSNYQENTAASFKSDSNQLGSRPQVLGVEPMVEKPCRQVRKFAKASESPREGARLVNFVDCWKRITNNKWALKIIQEGLHLHFKS